MYRRTQAQKSEWTRDRRVEVNYRTLRYHWERGERIAQEKGIDVLVALAPPLSRKRAGALAAQDRYFGGASAPPRRRTGAGLLLDLRVA